jgi:hypothetical protein
MDDLRDKLTSKQKDAISSILMTMLGAGVFYITHKHLSERGMHAAAAHTFGAGAGAVASSITHDELKKHLESNPHHLPAATAR